MKKRVVVDSEDSSGDESWDERVSVRWRRRQESMLRVGELVQDGSVADALLPALVRHLEALRALACTCQVWRAKVRAHFASLAQLDLRRHDMSEGNAAFVFGPLLKHRPDMHVAWLREDDDGTRRGGYCVLRGMKKWLDRRQRYGKWVLSKYGASQLVMFFMSRAVAKMPELRLVLPRDDEDRRKRPISFTCGQLSSLKFAQLEGTGGHVGEFHMVQNKLARPAFDLVAGCHLIAALEALTKPVWLQNADLDLSYLHLDDEGARTVALKMRKNAPPKRICLAHTMSRNGSAGMLGVLGGRNLSNKHKACVDVSRLQCLLIQGGRLWESVPLLALDSTLRSLGDGSKLTKLDLINSRMGPLGMCTLSTHFKENRALHLLEELILQSNNLGNEGLVYLQQNGWKLPKLRFLDVGHNYLNAREEVNFVSWIGEKARWPCIKRVDLFYNSAPLFKLLEKTCSTARARCEWETLLNHEATWLNDSEASDFDVPHGHSEPESSGSDPSLSEEEEESNISSDEEEEEDHDE